MFRPIAPFTAALLAALGLAACTPAPSPAVPELRAQFKPGYPLGEAVKALKARNTTFSVMSAAECETMARQSALAAELRPRLSPLFHWHGLCASTHCTPTNCLHPHRRYISNPNTRITSGKSTHRCACCTACRVWAKTADCA